MLTLYDHGEDPLSVMVFDVGLYHAPHDYSSCSIRQMLDSLQKDVYLSHFKEDLCLLCHAWRTLIPCISQVKYSLHIPRFADHTSQRRLCILYTVLSLLYVFILQIVLDGANSLPRDAPIMLTRPKTNACS